MAGKGEQGAAKAAFLETIKQWEAREIKMGNTTFYFEKLLPMKGFDVLEIIRPGLADALDRMPMFDPTKLTPEAGIALLFSVVLKVSPATIRLARDQMFQEVKFTNAAAQTRMAVAGNEDTAFMDLEPIRVYEVIGRALAVNFTESLSVILSRMRQAPLSPSPPIPT